MGRLKTRYMFPENGLMKPGRNFTPQPPLTFGRMKEACAVQGVAGEGRSTLSGDDKQETIALTALAFNEMVKLHARDLDSMAVQVEARIRFHLAAGQALGGAPVERGQGRRLIGRAPLGHGGMPRASVVFCVMMSARGPKLCHWCGARCLERRNRPLHFVPQGVVGNTGCRTFHRGRPSDSATA
jgi:hypothetical protein